MSAGSNSGASRIGPASNGSRLVRVMGREQLGHDRLGAVADLEGVEILVVMSRGEVYAVANMCTHRTFWLNHATVHHDTGELECPWHHGRYDLRTGAATLEPCVTPLRTFPVTLDGDDVLVSLSAEGAG